MYIKSFSQKQILVALSKKIDFGNNVLEIPP